MAEKGNGVECMERVKGEAGERLLARPGGTSLEVGSRGYVCDGQ